MRPTLVAIHHRQLGERLFRHGAEIEPELLEGALLDYWLDHKWCRGMPERRSLYRLFALFSGCKESEHLNADELDAYTLTK
jgi:hypothetical protein